MTDADHSLVVIVMRCLRAALLTDDKLTDAEFADLMRNAFPEVERERLDRAVATAIAATARFARELRSRNEFVRRSAR